MHVTWLISYHLSKYVNWNCIQMYLDPIYSSKGEEFLRFQPLVTDTLAFVEQE